MPRGRMPAPTCVFGAAPSRPKHAAERAFRGFGAPQVHCSPRELMVVTRGGAPGVYQVWICRRKWMLRLGDTTATGQKLTESVSAELVLDYGPASSAPNRPNRQTAPSATVAASPSFSTVPGSPEVGRKKLQGTHSPWRHWRTGRAASSPPRRKSARARKDFLPARRRHTWRWGRTGELAASDTSIVPDSGRRVALPHRDASRPPGPGKRLRKSGSASRRERPPSRSRKSHQAPNPTRFTGTRRPIAAMPTRVRLGRARSRLSTVST